MRHALVVGGLALILFHGAAFSETTLEASALTTGITATLYLDGPLVDVRAIAAQGPWLYAAVREGDGAQHIDVWRVEPPAAPELVDTLSYGTVLSSPFAFAPLAIIPRDGVVLIQAEEVLRTYRHGVDGKLVFVEELNLITGLGAPLMGQLYAGGAFASHLQQVAPPQFIGEIPEEAIHQQVIISLRDPAHPFLVRAPGNGLYGEYLDTDNPVNTTWQGKPASISFDASAHEVVLTTFERTVQSHLDTFWAGKLEALFAPGSLDMSLEAHMQAVIDGLDVSALRTDLLTQYSTAIDLDASTVEAIIRSQHSGSEDLQAVLETHGLSLDESLELSLRKMAVEGLDDALRAQLGRVFLQPVLDAWLDETLGVAWDGLSSAQIAGEIAQIFDGELDVQGAVRYLTLNLIAPLLDDPDFMLWTLGDLIDFVVDSDVGATIDVTLTVTGAGLIGDVLAIIDDLPFFDLPNCAIFPGDTRELINLALFSGGADLDAGGLAWFEMLKLYQYLTGGLDFASYTAEVDAALRDLHLDLAEDFSGKYLGFFAGIEGFAVANDALGEIAGVASIDQALGDLLARAARDRLEMAGLETETTLRGFLEGLGLTFDFFGEPTGDVDSLVAALATGGLDTETVGSLIARAESAAVDIDAYLETYLKAHLEALFGVAIPGVSLRAALYIYLTEQLDLSGPLGLHLDGLLGGFSVEVFAENILGAYLTGVLNAFEGDCIAQWLLALDVATGIATPLMLEAYPLAAKAALTSAYHAGIDAAISAMLSLVANTVIGDLSGHWPSWTEQVTQTTYRFTVPAVEDGYDVTLHGQFVWEDRVALLLSYRSKANPFALRPVALQTFLPDEPETSRAVVDLGVWERVDFVAQAGKDLFAAGRHAVDGETAHGLLIDLERLEGRHFTGEDFLPLAVTQQMAALDRGALLALRGEGIVTIVPNTGIAAAPVARHTGDTNGNGMVELNELLRLIQFYNAQGFHCAVEAATTEDGFVPGSEMAAEGCAPHTSDYDPQDWHINLSELLRFIQFFNSGGYFPCAGGEDHFCPQTAK